MNRRAMLVSLAFAGAAGSASATEKAEKKKGGGETFLQLPTLTATVLRPDGGRGVMTVEVGIDVVDAGLRKRAQASVPLLRDAYLREMLSYAPTLGPGAAPNPDLISTQLQRATDRTLGRPGAKVLLGSILVN
jgi:hypothetical protein